MSYQQIVYHWAVRWADPVLPLEIARGTRLPVKVVRNTLDRLHKRSNLMEPVGSRGKGCKWRVVDDSVTWIPDRRGKADGSIEAIIGKWKRRSIEMATVER